MSIRLRSTPFALAGAFTIALALSGTALGADLASETGATDTSTAPVAVDGTTTAFVDADGDGIADSCDTAVVPDPAAATAADAATDTNGDGTVSVDEAARSNRVGGPNCNHGGYVSGVAQAQCDTAPASTTESTTESTGDEADGTTDGTSDESNDDCGATSDTPTQAAPTGPCVVVAPPAFDPTADTSPGAFGRYVASVAASDAVGGPNCNHGGAVSEAVHAAKDAARAAHDAAKAERAAARAAAKALRSHGSAGASHGHGHGHGHND